MAQPSNQDQLQLELINRARANPEAEATRLGLSDVNEGIDSGVDLVGYKQPLAWNVNLSDAAAGHTTAMFDQNEVGDNDFFAHINPNTNITIPGRIADVGYDGAANGAVAENIAYARYDLKT